MKRLLLLILVSVVILCSCASEKTVYDVDLTALSSTMVYAEVYNIVQNPTDYLNKSIHVKGTFNASYYEGTKRYYYYVIIADATACCNQGLEFVWSGEHAYPGDYPEEGASIELAGVYGTYDELGVTYYYIDVDSIKVL